MGVTVYFLIPICTMLAWKSMNVCKDIHVFEYIKLYTSLSTYYTHACLSRIVSLTFNMQQTDNLHAGPKVRVIFDFQCIFYRNSCIFYTPPERIRHHSKELIVSLQCIEIKHINLVWLLRKSHDESGPHGPYAETSSLKSPT